MVATRQIRFRYPQGQQLAFPDIQIDKGEHTLLLGNSGCGKTTLLHLLGGLLSVEDGAIEIEGTDITMLSEHELDHFRGHNIGFVFQRNHLVTALTVEQNLSLANFASRSKPDLDFITDVLKTLDLTDQRHATVTKLSQGQAQRVAIARALVNNPALILADEPTSSLDDINCEKVISLLLTGARQFNATLIVATHDQRLKQRISKCVQL